MDKSRWVLSALGIGLILILPLSSFLGVSFTGPGLFTEQLSVDYLILVTILVIFLMLQSITERPK